ncbi:hypothetical protein [Hymenobacter sp. BT730]|uniref:hypothetical protein n=1 Tax=Hymenobacter sp. BT730 TaxID=3063332 RepID=UPI0026E0007F|nr:hypothetical protein [Hymenobacter sp. BT730]
MLLTPTYDVFDLYQVHQTKMRRFFPCCLPRRTTLGREKIPALNASALKDKTEQSIFPS